ncbi:MAG: hypothetical protein JNL43_13395 [Flavobacteriales bacterium]|nr:hypothetical protein [Flavobacteriales bacterium]
MQLLRLLFLVPLLLPFSLQAQLLPQTHVVEAYNCSCGISTKSTNSIQLGVRLDKSTAVYTALRTLVGCSRILLNVDGERFPVHITLANGRDNIARLEPIEMALNITAYELKLKRVPNYALLAPGMETGAKPFVVILQGEGMSKQKRGSLVPDLTARDEGGLLRYQFSLSDREETDIDFDRLMGGPVWVEKGKDHLAGLITGMKTASGRTELTVTGVENILDKSQYRPYQLYLNEFRTEQGDCGPKQVYWDGFGTYKYRTGDEPTYARISSGDKWEKAMRVALLRIREHMRDSIPAKGNNREGEPSLCVFVNDLENVYNAFAEQATATERENWPVLPRFVKAYSSVFCKQRRYSDSELTRDIIDLNFWIDQIGGDELRLLYELGYDWSKFEGFVKRYFMLSQVGGIRKRYDDLMARTDEIAQPCTQLAMLDELNGVVDSWARHVGQVNDPHYAQLLQYRKILATMRDSMLTSRMERMEKDTTDLSLLQAAIEKDTCLNDAEKLLLLKRASNRAVEKEKADLVYGFDVVEDLRSTIVGSYGQDALANVITRVFRVEEGVGVELTIRGGGAILDKRLLGRTGDASDTTTVYRSGFPLGSVGDTLSAAIAQVFWDRMCEDYSSRKWAYRTESVEVTGMADGVPVRSRLIFSEACQQQLSAQHITDPNEQLAYARAWSLVEQIKTGDRCGLYELLTPTLHHQTYRERGGAYRGVSMRAVMKRL